MRIIDPSFEILAMPEGLDALRVIELAGRTCYKSEDKISEGSARQFVSRIVGKGHESVIEHATATVRFVTDRGVTHELVRHRLASYSQESTRYANYSLGKFGSEITVVRPPFWTESDPRYLAWKQAMLDAEKSYLALTAAGAKAQEARSVLPNSLKTEIIMTANFREWRHVFKLRCDGAAHPQIRQIMLPLLEEFARRVPSLFDDLRERFSADIEGFRNLPQR